MENPLHYAFGIITATIGLPTILGLFLSYVYLKPHVSIEKKIKTYFTQELQASLIKHVHHKNLHYRQNHFILGLGFIFQKSDLGYSGFLERALPNTISCDFEFTTQQTIENLLCFIQQICEKSQFKVIEDRVHPHSLLISKGSLQIRINIITLKDGEGRYRLISTWLTL